MNRRNFFSVLCAPLIAPLLPADAAEVTIPILRLNPEAVRRFNESAKAAARMGVKIEALNRQLKETSEKIIEMGKAVSEAKIKLFADDDSDDEYFVSIRADAEAWDEDIRQIQNGGIK